MACNKVWTESEIEFLRKNYKRGPLWISKRLDRTVYAIKDMMKRLGLVTRNIRKWQDDEIVFLEKNCDKLSIQDMADQLGRSYSSVRNKIIELHLNGCQRGERTNDKTNDIKIGAKVKVRFISGLGYGRTVVTHEGTVEFIHDRFITINTGKYRVSVLKADMICGEAMIKAVGK